MHVDADTAFSARAPSKSAAVRAASVARADAEARRRPLPRNLMISPLAAGQVDGYPYTDSSGFQAVIFVSLLETLRTPEIPANGQPSPQSGMNKKARRRGFLVGAAGFEPATLRTQTVRATRLRHAPPHAESTVRRC